RFGWSDSRGRCSLDVGDDELADLWQRLAVGGGVLFEGLLGEVRCSGQGVCGEIEADLGVEDDPSFGYGRWDDAMRGIPFDLSPRLPSSPLRHRQRIVEEEKQGKASFSGGNSESNRRRLTPWPLSCGWERSGGESLLAASPVGMEKKPAKLEEEVVASVTARHVPAPPGRSLGLRWDWNLRENLRDCEKEEEKSPGLRWDRVAVGIRKKEEEERTLVPNPRSSSVQKFRAKTWIPKKTNQPANVLRVGQRGSSANPSAMLSSLVSKRAKLHEELRSIERQLYDMETSYLQDPSQCGNVLKGFEGFLSSSKNTALLKRSKKFQPEDRLFSLSSVTSPAAEEQAVGRDDGKSDFGPGRSRGGGIYANGQGKPKRGRGTPRDAKRIRAAADPDFDYDDDPDLM
ncbi:unnamed protein product, partial [Linum tenue]